VDKTSDKNPQPAIGRAKTVIVDHEIGIVSEVIVRTVTGEQASRLDFRGPAKFKADTKQHIKSIILPIIDKIMDSLGVSRKNYEISAVNLGATASADIGVEITGFSADLPLLFALLSASLKIPLRQDILCTGHVASIDGDIAPVRGIPIKLEAALTTPGISAFVLPDLDTDGSLQKQTPIKYKAAKESMLKYKGDIKIHSVVDIYDAAKIFLTDESIVSGSLEAGFFYVKSTDRDSESPIDRTVSLIFEENDKRFWDVLGYSLLNRRVQKAKKLLRIYVDFHIKNQFYPEDFGRRLFHLVISLPPSIRRSDGLFPLVSMELYIKLTQYIIKNDHKDLQQLHKAVFGEGLDGPFRQTDENKGLKTHEGGLENELLESLLAELSEENLARKIGFPLDEARLSYVMDKVTVNDGFEFNDSITAFFAHMFRYTGSPAGHMDTDALSTDAIDLVTEAFERKGGYKAALSEGLHGINGGLRIVFDAMTEHLKQKQRGKYISMVFKVLVEPLGWDTQVKLMKVFMKRLEPDLPSDLKDLPSEKLASHWEKILRYYVEFKAKMTDLIKRL
jgi:hypothetical protein